MSRSLIHGSSPIGAGTRNVLNPVTVLGGAVLVTTTCAGGSGGFALTKPQKAMLNTIESQYTIHLEDKQYEKIPNDLVGYLKLYSALSNTRVSYRTNKDVSLLLTITAEALAGAIAAYGLNARIIELQIQNLYLQGVIETLISGVNIKPAFDMNDGGISLTKELKLAPLFMYYIQTYGTPEPGDGFDTDKLTLIYNTLINNGIDPGIVNIQSVLPANTCTTKTELVDLYRQLAVFVTSVNTLQETYASGNISTVATLLTQEVYQQLSTQLDNLALELNIDTSTTRAYVTVEDMYSDYEKIHTNTSSALKSLHKAVEQYATLEDYKAKYLSAKEKADILLDPVKLREYIEEMNRRSQTSIFPDSNVKVAKATLKPEYAEYIRLYGYPEGHIFDPIKLGKIINNLNQTSTSRTMDKSVDQFIQRSMNYAASTSSRTSKTNK